MSATDQIGHVAVRICQKVFDEVSNGRIMKEDQNVVAESRVLMKLPSSCFSASSQSPLLVENPNRFCRKQLKGPERGLKILQHYGVGQRTEYK